MSNLVNIAYTYHNPNGITKIWTTLPMDHPNTSASHKAENKYVDDGQNTVFTLTLKENELFTINYSIDTQKPCNKTQLSESEKAYYLRSGTLIVVDSKMKDLALQITAQADAVTEKAEAIFYYLVNEYKYVYPPKSRGNQSFLQTKQGDCGEYSFLFTSLCRSAGIPSRTTVGTWANGKMNNHVWNEFFVENVGWIPVDCSLAYMQKKKKFKFLSSNIRTFKWTRYFGELEGQRVIFSYDAEIALPTFHNTHGDVLQQAAYPPIASFQVNGSPFYWGYESIDGHAPYIQPIYPQFAEENLTVHPKKDANKYLGQWKITETGSQRFFYTLKSISFFVFIICLSLSLILNNPLFHVISGIAIVLTCISFIARKERIVLFSVLTLYFMLYLGSNVMKLS